MKVKITGAGYFVPTNIVNNKMLEDKFRINNQRIYQKTGILERRYVDKDVTTTDIAVLAIQDLISKTKFSISNLDCLIISNLAADCFFPSTAVSVINKIGASKAYGFDISAACSGFLYAINIAKSMILSGEIKNAIICSAERMSMMLNNFDHKTAVLFSDGAGAILLESVPDSSNSYLIGGKNIVNADNINDVYFRTPFSSPNWLQEKFELEGYKVFQNGVNLVIKYVSEYLETNSINKKSIDYIIPHQANMRMIEEIASGLNISIDKFLVNIESFGNTGSASIPICFAQFLNEHQKIKQGQRILFFSLGAGYTISSVDFIF